MAVKSPPQRSDKPPARQPRPPRETPKAAKPRPPRNNERYAHDLWGVGLVAFALMLLVSLIVWRQAGSLGSLAASGLRDVFGIGAFVIPFLLGAIGVGLIAGREQHTRANFAGGAALLFFIFISWWQLGHSPHDAPFADAAAYGGWLGGVLSGSLRALVGDISSHIVLLALTVGAVLWATDMRLLHLFDHAAQGAKRVAGPLTQGAASVAGSVQDVKQRAREAKEKKAQEAPTPASSATPPLSERGERPGAGGCRCFARCRLGTES